jgi:hypothetical protein
MKRGLAAITASCALACGGSAKVNATLFLDPVPDSDLSCIGVAGFEVVVSSLGRDFRSGPVVGMAPVLDPKGCRLDTPFTVGDLDPDEPIEVQVTGYDGSGAPRVTGRTRMNKLESEAHVALQGMPTPPLPVLVVHRTQLLEGAFLKDVQSLTVSTAKMGPPSVLVETSRTQAGAYFNPEPAAYGVPGLREGGSSDGLDVSLEFGGVAVAPRRLVATWNPTRSYYEAK